MCLTKLVKATIAGAMIWLAAEGFCYVNSRNNEIDAMLYKQKSVESLKRGNVIESKTYRDFAVVAEQKSEGWKEIGDSINPFYYIKGLKNRQ